MATTQKALKILRASAGSGKTYRLTLEYLKLLFSGTRRFKKALAVTFTNKATGEMRHRIMSSLRALADTSVEHPEFYKELKEAYPNLNIREHAGSIYSEILHAYNYFSVVTIDKFVQKVVRSFAYELKLNTGYAIELNLEKVIADLMERFKKRLDADPDLLDLMIEYVLTQMEAGKSYSYKESLHNFVKNNLNEKFFDFENAIYKYADVGNVPDITSARLKENISRFEGGLNQRLEALNAAFISLQIEPEIFKGGSRSYFTKINNPINFDKLSDYFRPIKALADGPEAWYTNKTIDIISPYYTQLHRYIADIYEYYVSGKADYFTAKAINKNFNFLRLLTQFSDILKEYRLENDVLLISDATLLLNNLTKEYADNPGFIWEKYGSRLEHFLFDEFQDTSRKQWQNFKPLVLNAMAGQDDTKTRHLIVGDAKQSIYRWRNSDWELFQYDVESDIGEDRVSVGLLNTNYRSREAIVHFNNYLYNIGVALLQSKLNDIVEATDPAFYKANWITSGDNNILYEVYNDAQQEVSPAKIGSGGIVELVEIPVLSNAYRQSQAIDGALEKMAVKLFDWIENKIYQPGEIAILVRRNSEAAKIIDYIDQFLAGKNEASLFQVVSGGTLKLDASPAVQIVLLTMEMLLHESEKAGQATLNCIHYYTQIQSQFTADKYVMNSDAWLEIAGKPLSSIQLLPEALHRRGQELLTLPVPELVEQLIVIFDVYRLPGYIPYLMAFRDEVARYCQAGDLGVQAFLDWWSELNEPSLPETTKSDVVRIVSIHKSKGLEFNVVMIPFAGWDFNGDHKSGFWVDLKDTQYPELGMAPVAYSKTALLESSIKDQYFREMMFNYMDNLNLLYVATTRAKSHLYIAYPGKGATELASYIAGDLLRILYDEFDRDKLIQTDSNLMQLYDVSKSDMETHPGSTTWTFDRYPVSNHLNIQLSKSSADQIVRISADHNARFGAAVHDVLAVCTTTEEVPSAVQQLVRDGWVRPGEADRVEEMAIRALTHTELADLLSRQYQAYNEQEILMPSGKTFRPDKVLVGPEETIVIDYKFTGEQAESHKKQISGYKAILEQMGFVQVKTFLFYGITNQLIEV